MSLIPRPMEASDVGSHVKPYPRDLFPKFNPRTTSNKWNGKEITYISEIVS